MVGPGTGTAGFAGSAPEVFARFNMLAGWETDGEFVFKSNSDPIFGLAFYDVGDIYTDGCRWETVNPPVGPTVDDLVEAYKDVQGFEGTARDVTVDGYRGKQIQFTVPEYEEQECLEGKFAIILEDGKAREHSPSLWAQTPNQRNELRIVDVDGTRLVIVAGYPPTISAKDRTDLGTILDSVEIG